MKSIQASEKKRQGHYREKLFNQLFGKGRDEKINYSGASPDCAITDKELKETLLTILRVKGFKVSLKGGVTTQFHLGNCPELTKKSVWKNTSKINEKGNSSGDHGVSWVKQQKVLKTKKFWNKYFKKDADILCYTDDCTDWWLFKFEDVIGFIVSNFDWRLLETGRIKGDYISTGKQILTYENRKDKKTNFALGAMGSSNGLEFKNLLSQNLNKIRLIIDNKSYFYFKQTTQFVSAAK